MEQYQAAATALLSTAIAIAGWLYSRRIGVQKAQEQLTAIHASTIQTLQDEVASVRRMMDGHIANVADCEKRLQAAETALAKWDTMLGQIWVRDFGEPE